MSIPDAAVQADFTVCVCAGVDAGNVGHSAADSVCSGGVLGSGTQSAQQHSGGERL